MRVITTEEDAAQQIETIIDIYGVQLFLSLCSFVCGEKAAHIAEHWQDAARAKAWMHLSHNLDVLTAYGEKENL